MKSISITALALFFASSVYAADDIYENISWGFLVIGLFGGLALFLYGLEQLSEGMKKAAGNQMRSILAKLTQNRIIGFLAGAFVTMVIQSSSATTVMLVSFVQAELLTFAKSLGVILGADIGTTVTAQLIAFKLTDYALLMVAVGFSMRTFSKNHNFRNTGEVILGFGILFFGMKLMSDAMKPLQSYPSFIDMMKGLEHPLLGLLVGTVFTALVQSSSATTGVVIVLAQQGLITLEAGIPLVFGANIGTCVTAGLACIGMDREAKRVALAHVLFKVGGVLLFIFWIPVFAELIRGIAVYFGSGTTRQIANAHTIFNVSLGVCFLPFTTLFAGFILKVLPERRKVLRTRPVTWHLDESLISTPVLAMDVVRTEISRMAKLLHRMLRAIIIPFMSDVKWISKDASTKEEADLLAKEIPSRDEFFPELSLLEGIDMREEKIDYLEEKIGSYLLRIAQQPLSDQQAQEVYAMISIAKDLESIGDTIHRNMLPLIEKKQALEMDFSEEGKEELMIYHNKVSQQTQRLQDAFEETNPDIAEEIMTKESKYLDLESTYRVQHLERLIHKRRESEDTHEVHMELMDLLKQINVYTGNIAKTYLDVSKS